mmetsp:Transcript_89696/g.262232  ORF Transcript_89696/g.262232 Transcript_89696/m.262232 type:complete len:261 (+) Transcript_89696:370-1152(+)
MHCKGVHQAQEDEDGDGRHVRAAEHRPRHERHDVADHVLQRVAVDRDERDGSRPGVVQLVHCGVHALVLMQEAVGVEEEDLLHRHPDHHVPHERPGRGRPAQVVGLPGQQRPEGRRRHHGTQRIVQTYQRHRREQLPDVEVLSWLDLPPRGPQECRQRKERADAPEGDREEQAAAHGDHREEAMREDEGLQPGHPRREKDIQDELLDQQQACHGGRDAAEGWAHHVPAEQHVRHAARPGHGSHAPDAAPGTLSVAEPSSA